MADGNGTKDFMAPAMRYIVEENTADTLLNCALIVRFMGRRLNEAEGNGFQLDDDDRDAIYRIMATVGDALVFERSRVEESQQSTGKVRS